LELEQIRRQSLKVDLEVNLENPHVKIRPLIFLPYIENAFKYSNSNSGTDAIEIKINTDKEKLKFSCKNSKGTLHNSLNGGIGLLNASRRLELSYPDMHSLDIVDTKDHFSVNVEIELV